MRYFTETEEMAITALAMRAEALATQISIAVAELKRLPPDSQRWQDVDEHYHALQAQYFAARDTALAIRDRVEGYQ
jgi:hypothetical protein